MGKTFQKERMNKEVAEEDRKKSEKPKTTTKRTTDATKKVADKAAAALIKKPTDTEAAANPEYKRKQKLLDGDPDEIPFLPKYVQQHIEDFGRPPFRVPNMKRNHKTMEEFMEKYRNK